MTQIPTYVGQPQSSKRDPTTRILAYRRPDQTRPDAYLADPGLVDAVNVALLLGQPLLLTGEPGTGKTQLAYNLAWELGLGEPLKFDTKSTSTAVDLFYTYNAVGRLHAAQNGEGSFRAADFITYNALGEAIVRANVEGSVKDLLPHGFRHNGRPRRSVVLIDEIDKAARDFPNDILNEVEGMYFRIPELSNRIVRSDPSMQPILMITSNSEKNLPDAFLRRCIYYNIPFPDEEQLVRIVEARIGPFVGDAARFLAEALALFTKLRAPESGLRKPPGTAALLAWLIAVNAVAPGVANPLVEDPNAVMRTVSSLVKTAEDQRRAHAIITEWVGAIG